MRSGIEEKILKNISKREDSKLERLYGQYEHIKIYSIRYIRDFKYIKYYKMGEISV